MKKLLVIGIVALMGLAVAANAAVLDDNWYIQVRVADGTLSQGTAWFGTSATAKNPGEADSADAVYSTQNASGEIISLDQGGVRASKDMRAPVTEANNQANAKIWNLNVYSYNASAPKTLTFNAWMKTSDANIGIAGDVKVLLFKGAVTQSALTNYLPLITSATTPLDLGDGIRFLYAFGKTSPTCTVSPAAGNGFVPTDAQVRGLSLPSVPTTGQAFTMVAYIPSAQPPQTPEPGSMLALASGLVGLVGFGIRRRK